MPTNFKFFRPTYLSPLSIQDMVWWKSQSGLNSSNGNVSNWSSVRDNILATSTGPSPILLGSDGISVRAPWLLPFGDSSFRRTLTLSRSFNQQSFSVFSIVRLLSRRGLLAAVPNNVTQTLISNNGTAPSVSLNTTNTRGSIGYFRQSDSTWRSSGLQLPTSKSLIGLICNGSNVTLVCNHQDWTDNAAISNQSATNISFFSDSSSNNYAPSSMSDLMFIPRAISSQELFFLRNWARSEGTIMDAPNRLLIIGESTSHSSSTTPDPVTVSSPMHDEIWHTRLNLGLSCEIYNNAISGASIGSLIEPDRLTWVSDLYNSSKNCIAVVWGGSNDLLQGASASTTASRILNYCSSLKASGWKVICVGIAPRRASTQYGNALPGLNETTRSQVNSTVASSPSSYNAYYDITQIPVGQSAAANNPALYPDGMHPSQEGHRQVAEALSPIIKTFLI